MKKILTALLIIMALSFPAHAEQEETNIDGEWYIATYFHEYGTATKDEEGNYHAVIYGRDYVFDANGIQTLNEKYSIFGTEPGEGCVFRCYVFVDSGEECTCYSTNISDHETPAFFYDGDIYEYGIDTDEEDTDDDMHYVLMDDTLYIMHGSSYTKAETAKLGKSIMMCEFEDKIDEELYLRDKMRLFVRPFVFEQKETPQDAAE